MLNETKPFLPNFTLRMAREERGWSQQQVATLVGTNTFTVCRWEQGRAFPSPHYRQKLCKIFGKTPKDLGLVVQKAQKAVPASPEPEEQAGSRTSERIWLNPTTSPRPSNDGYMIGRTEISQSILRRLTMGKDTALCGLPGVGKTALALDLVHSKDVLARFPDGILWISLGQTTDLQASLRAWARTLGSVETTRLHDINALGQALAALVKDRRLLFVIDDAWDIHEALACKIGGWQSSHLLTTRLPSLAVQFAHEGAIKIPPLTQEDGFQLLARFIPDIPVQEQIKAMALAQAVGGLPLALTLMGHHLQTQAFSGHPRRIQTALASLQEPAARFSLAELYSPSEGPTNGALRSLPSVIAPSIQFLDEKTRHTLRGLALLAPNPNAISEEAARAISDMDHMELLEQLDILLDAGLLESDAQGYYSLHPTLVDYLSLLESHLAVLPQVQEHCVPCQSSGLFVRP